MKKVIVKCDYCGNSIELIHQHRLSYNHNFCNKRCEAQFRQKLPNVRCSICGKPFSVPQSRVDKLKFGKICCSFECAGKLKSRLYIRNNNPNHKYDKDLSMFFPLTNDGAYILGMLYSDGTINAHTYAICLYQHYKYGSNIYDISKKIFGTLDRVKERDGANLFLLINDKKLVEYILSLGGIKRGKKSDIVSMPNIPEDKKWSFICGYFDGDGGFKYSSRYPQISISSNSDIMLEQIAEYWKVDYKGNNKIFASGYKALDICGKMYKKSSFRNSFKYNYYIDILNWEPLSCGPWYKGQYFKCKKLDPFAIIPTKDRVTDSGYDIYAIKLYKEGVFYVADTRIAVEPIPGYYFQLFGRSSLPVKFGFQFALGTGVIDRGYVGSLKMYLLKIDNSPLPKLPFKCGQIVPTKTIHVEFKEVDELNESARGTGGFGSTGE